MNVFHLRRLIPLLFVLLWLAMVAPVQAAGVVGDGTPASCTDAALAAALAGGGAVTFDCGPDPVTIFVTHNVIAGGQVTAVDGGGLVTLDAGGKVQHFLVLGGGELALRALTLQAGSFSTGGAAYVAKNAILRLDTVEIRDCVADGGGNDGGAVQNRGTLTADNVQFVRNHADDSGGAIYNQGGSVTIHSSSFMSNTAADGGALYNTSGGMDVADSLLQANRAGNYGGALLAGGGAVTVTNVTITQNQAVRGGGLFGMGSAVISVLNSTIYTNTAPTAGGVWNDTAAPAANVALKNSIVANNDAVIGGGAPGLNCDGPAMHSLGHNLVSDMSCIAPIEGDLTGVAPKLGELALNGGATGNYAPLPGSPVIDAGDNDGCPSVDQRGQARPLGPACDIGSVESGAALWLPAVTKE